jgi:hypothetical protein
LAERNNSRTSVNEEEEAESESESNSSQQPAIQNQRRVAGIDTEEPRYIFGTNMIIKKCFPTKSYHKIKQILIRMKDRKYMVNECVICIEPISNDSQCKMLSCFHIFHSECIHNWLCQTANCPVCNKDLNKKDHIKLDLKKHQMNSISVDNECFFSDHIIVRRPDILTNDEFRQAILCALPGEPFYKRKFDAKKKKPKADASSSDESSYARIDDEYRVRNRSKSTGDFEQTKVMAFNVKNRFGKGLWELSDTETNKGLVGPLKIVRLPSGRSIPETRIAPQKSNFFNSALNSVRGSIQQSPS